MGGEERREYRGKIAGFTLKAIAEMMDCSRPTAKAYVDQMTIELGGLWRVKKKHVGQMVARYWEVKWLRDIKRRAKEYLPSDGFDVERMRQRVLDLRKAKQCPHGNVPSDCGRSECL